MDINAAFHALMDVARRMVRHGPKPAARVQLLAVDVLGESEDVLLVVFANSQETLNVVADRLAHTSPPELAAANLAAHTLLKASNGTR